MNNQNRVLIRRGARELTPTETDLINGGFRTLSSSAPALLLRMEINTLARLAAKGVRLLPSQP